MDFRMHGATIWISECKVQQYGFQNARCNNMDFRMHGATIWISECTVQQYGLKT
jgi:hypothetical protein